MKMDAAIRHTLVGGNYWNAPADRFSEITAEIGFTVGYCAVCIFTALLANSIV